MKQAEKRIKCGLNFLWKSFSLKHEVCKRCFLPCKRETIQAFYPQRLFSSGTCVDIQWHIWGYASKAERISGDEQICTDTDTCIRNTKQVNYSERQRKCLCRNRTVIKFLSVSLKRDYFIGLRFKRSSHLQYPQISQMTPFTHTKCACSWSFALWITS